MGRIYSAEAANLTQHTVLTQWLFFCFSPSSLKPDFFSGFDEFFAFPRQAAAVLSRAEPVHRLAWRWQAAVAGEADGG